MTEPPHVTVGDADAALDQRLNDGLDKVNAAATPETPAARELTVKLERGDQLLGGASGWTWGTAAGIGMVWVSEEARGTGVGAQVMQCFEDEARNRGADHVFVTSFTFQAPGFYERLGYEEVFRWDAVPASGHDDVHFRKEL